MGKTRLLAIIVAFLIVAILAVLLLPGNDTQTEQPKEEEALVTVAAARTEIPAYTVITAEMIYLKEVPESSVHENDLDSAESAIGCRSLVTIAADEVIMQNHIIAPDAPENRTAYRIESGMRAVTVSVDDVSGICDQIRAGDHVDVVVAVQGEEKEEEKKQDENGAKNTGSGNGSGRPVALMLLQNIKVLSLDQDLQYAPKQDDDSGLYYYRTVTLEVTPEDVTKLDWAQYEGKIYLALRGENDEELTETAPYGAEQALQKRGG